MLPQGLAIFLGFVMCVETAPISMNTPAVEQTISCESDRFLVRFTGEGLEKPGRAIYIALDTDPIHGCAVVPYQQHAEGSTVFLPFRAGALYAARVGGAGALEVWRREWRRTKWSEHLAVTGEFRAEVRSGCISIEIPRKDFGMFDGTPADESEHDWIVRRIAAWAKDLTENGGWGVALPDMDMIRNRMTGD